MEQVRFFELTDDGYKDAGRAVLRDGVVVFEGISGSQRFDFDQGLCNPRDPPPEIWCSRRTASGSWNCCLEGFAGRIFMHR